MSRSDFGDDLLDLRDLLEREEEILDSTDAPDNAEWEFLQEMRELKEQFWGSIDEHAQNEPTLILDTYRADYAEDFASSVLGVNASEWPLTEIDWNEAADTLMAYDYSEFTIGRHTYYGRNF